MYPYPATGGLYILTSLPPALEIPACIAPLYPRNSIMVIPLPLRSMHVLYPAFVVVSSYFLYKLEKSQNKHSEATLFLSDPSGNPRSEKPHAFGIPFGK